MRQPFSVRKLMWWLQRWTSLFGWPGVTGCALLFFSALVQWGVLTQAAVSQDELRTLSSTLKSTLEEHQKRPSLDGKAALLARLSESLSSSTEQKRTNVIGQVHSAALAEGLTLQEMSFELSEANGSTYVGLDIVLPVNGSYVQLKRFIARLLAESPALALGGFTLNRQSVSDSTLEAQLRFTLYTARP